MRDAEDIQVDPALRRTSKWWAGRHAVLRTVMAATVMVAVAGLIGRSAAAEPPEPATPAAHGSHAGGEAPARDLALVSPRWWEGTDLIVTGRGDNEGYHLWIGRERERYAMRPLASIQPNGFTDDTWLGYQCVTGDGLHVVVTVAPRMAVNKPELRDRGGLTYLVNIRTGKVRPAVRGIAFKYHATGCGTGSDVALLRHLDRDQRRSELLRLDAGTGEVSLVSTVNGQLTSPVPSGAGILALRGRTLVRVAKGQPVPTVVARVAGEPYRLTATPTGADLLVDNGNDVRVQRWDTAGLREVAAGPAGGVQLFPGSRGANVTLGATPAGAAGTGRPRLARLPDPHAGHAGYARSGADAKGLPAQAVSLQGKVVLAAVEPPAAHGDHHAGPDLSGAALFAADGSRLDWEAPVGRAATITQALPSTIGGTAAPKRALAGLTPKCGVARNDPRRQAYSSTPEQTRWAVEMASRNQLTGSRSRPANYLGSGLAAYSPSTDFPVPSLQPNGGRIPPPVMNGVLAQESNYTHGSWRTLRGSGGNPLIGDYYGSHYTIDVIDFANADCGYGVAQVTTGMAAADTGISANGKAKIAIDYAENIQAGLGILARKWNELSAAGVRMNNNDPQYLENWYMALWAYNTGMNPQASTGNTSGCTPGPSCTDADGNWGLGWTNNPMNPDYPPGRGVFLRESYADAERPSEWAYQERILGWAETPIQIPWGQSAYQAAEAGPDGDAERPITYPRREQFCDNTNRCDPAHDPAGEDDDFCTRADNHCWWHEPVQMATCQGPCPIYDCPRMCARTPFSASLPASEPAGVNAWKPACDSDLGPNAVIVDDLADPSANLWCPSRNWTTRGGFTYEVGRHPVSGAPIGEIDFHQVATGFGGHTWMTGNRLASDAVHRVTGTWTPNALAAGTYVVKAHIPVGGASAGSAVYDITTANGEVRQKVINQHEHWNHWKSLGTYQLGANANVVLSNVTRDDRSGGLGTVAFDAVAFVPVTGRPVEERIDAIAYFDEDQNIDMNLYSRFVDTPLRNHTTMHNWAREHAGNVLALPACTAGPRADCVMPATRQAALNWDQEVAAAGTDPVNHTDGFSIPAWMSFSNDFRHRPTSANKPAHFDTNDDSYKLRSGMRITYVVGPDGKIVDGSADIDYHQRTADTHLPKFVMEYLRAVQSDYGIALPDLTYTTTNLRQYDHMYTTAHPQLDGRAPGRSYRFAGWKPIVTDATGVPVQTGGRCVVGLFSSGGVIGFRPMIGTRTPSTAMEAYHQRLANDAAVPDNVATVAGEIYNMFFKWGIDGSMFGAGPPIWQELYVRACTDGTTETIQPGNSGSNAKPMVQYSFMPSQYLYRNGKAMGPAGGAWPDASPINRGDFNSFTRMPGAPGGGNPFGQCNVGSPTSGGNPWNLTVLTDNKFMPEIEPGAVHFCTDPTWESDPDIS